MLSICMCTACHDTESSPRRMMHITGFLLMSSSHKISRTLVSATHACLGNASFLNESVQLVQRMQAETKLGDMCSSRHDGTMRLVLPKQRHWKECLLALAHFGLDWQQWLTFYAQVCNYCALARSKVGLNSVFNRVCAHARPMLQQLTVILQHQQVIMLP